MKIRARLAFVVAAAATVALAAGATAAPNTITLTDIKGDANAVNGQGLEPGMGNNAGPAQRNELDIVSVSLASTGVTTTVKKKKVFTCTGFTATMELSAPAGANASYRILGTGVLNATQFWLQYSTAATGTTTTMRHNDGAAKTTALKTPAKLEGNKIVFTVTEADLKATGEKLAEFKMGSLGADTRTATAATVPAWDTMDEDETKSFSPCA